MKDSKKDNGQYMAVTLECLSGPNKGGRHIDRYAIMSRDSHALNNGLARKGEYIRVTCGADSQVREITGAMYKPFLVSLEPSRMDAERLYAKRLLPVPTEWQFIAEDICDALAKKRPAAPSLVGGLQIVRVADVEAEAIDWLWPQRFAVGKLSILTGDPGLGKSQFSLMLAAKVSRGEAWPNNEGHAPHGNVLLLSCEDEIGDTIRPRLEAAVNRPGFAGGSTL